MQNELQVFEALRYPLQYGRRSRGVLTWYASFQRAILVAHDWNDHVAPQRDQLGVLNRGSHRPKRVQYLLPFVGHYCVSAEAVLPLEA